MTSLLCAIAPTGWILVAARCVQGIAAAFLLPSSLAMINDRFNGAEQARAMPPAISVRRNFAVGNATTFFMYAGVSLGLLIVALFPQEAVGLSATQAGLATLPILGLSFLMAARFGGLAAGTVRGCSWRPDRCWRRRAIC